MTLDDLWRALALMAVIEGFLYALFPNHAKRMVAYVLALPADTLRQAGLMIAAVGVGALWLLRS